MFDVRDGWREECRCIVCVEIFGVSIYVCMRWRRSWLAKVPELENG